MSEDAIIVGAGPAGLGMAIALKEQGVTKFRILDKHGVGASFRAWPEDTRFITPSFPAHAYGCPDLNSIEENRSPGGELGNDRLSGAEYAIYLQNVLKRQNLSVEAPVEVLNLQPHEGGWQVQTSEGLLHSKTVIWATGEFTSPKTCGIPGIELCTHYAHVRTWRELDGQRFVILGGGESGMDAACHLVELGHSVQVLDRNGNWDLSEKDPSFTLSPTTQRRAQQALASGRLDLISGPVVERIEQSDKGYRVMDQEGIIYETDAPPLNCLGFLGGAHQIPHLWDFKQGQACLTGHDESTLHPGLFLAGPEVRHPGEVFCYIYKFRTRFPIVANRISTILNQTPDSVAP